MTELALGTREVGIVGRMMVNKLEHKAHARTASYWCLNIYDCQIMSLPPISSVTSHQQAIVWVTSQPVLNSHSHIKLNVAATWSSSGERDTMLYIDSGISPINSIGRVHSKVFPKNDYMCSLSLDQSLLTWWTWSQWEVCCLLYIFKTCSVGILKVEVYILANVTLQVLGYAGVKLIKVCFLE